MCGNYLNGFTVRLLIRLYRKTAQGIHSLAPFPLDVCDLISRALLKRRNSLPGAGRRAPAAFSKKRPSIKKMSLIFTG